MYDELNKVPFGIDFLKRFSVIFSSSFLAVTIAGILVGRYALDVREVSTLFALSGAGLPYSGILQITGLILFHAFFYELFISERFLTKMRFLRRNFLFFLTALVSTSVFSIIFNWFPVNHALSWICFILSFAAGFSVYIGITILKLKLERKKYGLLLANYKARHNPLRMEKRA